MTGSVSLSVRIAAAALMCITLLALVTLAAPAAHAGGSAPVIHWDSSMIYAGQNNGNPWGPVGENTIVHGANFPANEQLRLVIAPGDSNRDATVCKQAVVTVPIANIITDASGSFTQNFSWPAIAGQVNQAYSICSLLASDSSVASTRDDGPFTVLSSSPPAINLSATTVAVGGTITITGQNWVPPQPVSVNIAGCAACEPGSTEVTHGSTTSAGLNSGSFSLTVTIPASAKPGNYVVDALTPSGLEAFYTTGVKHLAITPATTSNPTPTATTSPASSPSATTTTASPTAAATKTTIAASGTTTNTTNTGTMGTTTTDSNGSDTNNTSGGNSGLVVALIGSALILFLVAAVILLILLRRRKHRQFGQFNPAGSSQANFPANNQTMQTMFAPGFRQPQQSGFYPQQNQQHYQHYSPAQVGATQSVQQGYWQQSQPQPQVQPQSAYLPNCSNCGRPLVPNMPSCATCGMPIAMMQR